MKMQFNSPAVYWTEALPVGNGRFGAMVFGGVEYERIELNEDTLWSGYPKDGNNPRAIQVLPEVRKHIEEETMRKQTALQGNDGSLYAILFAFWRPEIVMEHGDV